MSQQMALDTIIQLLSCLVVLLTAIPVHELAHGFVAYRLGDPTAKNAGRLTLNPFKHLDLFGTIALFVVHFGWAKPVPVNPFYFKNRKRGMALVSLAGPVSNLLMSILFMVCYKISFYLYQAAPSQGMMIVAVVLNYAVLINILLAVFNLLPIPPNDGFKLLGLVLPEKVYFTILKYETYGMILFVILVFTGVLSGPLGFLQEAVFTGIDFVTLFVDQIMKTILGVL